MLTLKKNFFINLGQVPILGSHNTYRALFPHVQDGDKSAKSVGSSVTRSNCIGDPYPNIWSQKIQKERRLTEALLEGHHAALLSQTVNIEPVF